MSDGQRWLVPVLTYTGVKLPIRRRVSSQRVVSDLCPGCNNDFDNTKGHIDSYNSLSSYWVYPSAQNTPFNVSYQYCAFIPKLGVRCRATAKAALNIGGPKGSINPNPPHVTGWSITPVLNSCNGGQNLQYLKFAQNVSGTVCAWQGTPGIVFNGSASKVNGGGKLFWVQILANLNTITVPPSPAVPANAQSGLDNTYPYLATNGDTAQDSPVISLPPRLTQVERMFHAQMFEMWTSNNKYFTRIGVPLGFVQWDIDGRATLERRTWTLTANIGAANRFSIATDVGEPSHGYPIWTNVVLNTAH